MSENLSHDQYLHRQVDSVSPGLFASMGRISLLDTVTARKVIDVLVAAACQHTNYGIIAEARELLSKIPPDVLKVHLSLAGQELLNLDDEWEFRRWVELLKLVWPSEMAKYISNGLKSSAADVQEASQFYASGRHGPVEGLSGSS